MSGGPERIRRKNPPGSKRGDSYRPSDLSFERIVCDGRTSFLTSLSAQNKVFSIGESAADGGPEGRSGDPDQSGRNI